VLNAYEKFHEDAGFEVERYGWRGEFEENLLPRLLIDMHHVSFVFRAKKEVLGSEFR